MTQHQGSGGNQARILYDQLTDLGCSVWYDNAVASSERNLDGMRRGVRQAVTFLIFLSGRKESVQGGQSVVDTTGQYEGTFTRWFCHEEMGTAREQELRFVGVMETDERHCKPDFALEKSRARTGGKDGSPVHDKHVEANLRLRHGPGALEVCVRAPFGVDDLSPKSGPPDSPGSMYETSAMRGPGRWAREP